MDDALVLFAEGGADRLHDPLVEQLADRGDRFAVHVEQPPAAVSPVIDGVRAQLAEHDIVLDVRVDTA